jgi:predicted lipoprotein with Yx(FWY)xxD motif
MRGVIRWILPVVLVGVAGVSAAMAMTASGHSSGTVKAAKSAKYGTILVGANGRVLYRYTPDKKGKSVCTGACVTYWPALLVKTKATAGPGVKQSLLGTIKAAHGMRQVTYAGWPLYYFRDDKKAGQTNGQGYQKIWYLVGPSGALVKKELEHGTTTTNTTTTSDTTTSSGGAWG